MIERLGREAVRLGHKVTGYRKQTDGVVVALVELATGGARQFEGALLFGADGIHSSVRAQMHPAQPPIHWGGTIMWRGTARGVPIRTARLMSGWAPAAIASCCTRSRNDEHGLADINWIAEKTYDTDHDWTRSAGFARSGCRSSRTSLTVSSTTGSICPRCWRKQTSLTRTR